MFPFNIFRVRRSKVIVNEEAEISEGLRELWRAEKALRKKVTDSERIKEAIRHLSDARVHQKRYDGLFKMLRDSSGADATAKRLVDKVGGDLTAYINTLETSLRNTNGKGGLTGEAWWFKVNTVKEQLLKDYNALLYAMKIEQERVNEAEHAHA